VEYVSRGSKSNDGEDGVLNVSEPTAVAYSPRSGGAVAGWGDVAYVEVDLDDDDAYEAECARLERILMERGIIEPYDGDINLDDLDGPEELQPRSMEDLYRMLEEGRADLLAGRVCSHEESMREFRRETLEELRQMLINGHI